MDCFRHGRRSRVETRKQCASSLAPATTAIGFAAMIYPLLAAGLFVFERRWPGAAFAAFRPKNADD